MGDASPASYGLGQALTTTARLRIEVTKGHHWVVVGTRRLARGVRDGTVTFTSPKRAIHATYPAEGKGSKNITATETLMVNTDPRHLRSAAGPESPRARARAGGGGAGAAEAGLAMVVVGVRGMRGCGCRARLPDHVDRERGDHAGVLREDADRMAGRPACSSVDHAVRAVRGLRRVAALAVRLPSRGASARCWRRSR